MHVLLEALAPGILVIGAAWVVLPWLRADDQRARAVMAAVMVALMWRYLLWRWLATVPPAGLTLDFTVGVLFVLVETLMIAGTTLSLAFLTRLGNRSPAADRNAAWLEAQHPPPLVDVFICTYNEDEAILERTIVGALSMDYPRYRVWVLDDGRRAWLEALCQRLGCGYLTRPDNAHAKAGNINNGAAPCRQPARAAGLHQHPRCRFRADAAVPAPRAQPVSRRRRRHRADAAALHQSRPDLQTNLSMARVWPDEQRYFFDVVMASKDAWGAAFCCGTSSLIRFAPLMQRLGGFPDRLRDRGLSRLPCR